MSLEEVLRILENDSGERRNPEGYYFSIFGEPSEKGVWGYRVEGHHVSRNFTVVNGRAVDAPSFFGANPAEVREGPRKGLRALAAEEDLARELLTSLEPAQKRVAIVDQSAYKDILTAASRRASLKGQPSGLPAAKMSKAQFERLLAVLEEYVRNLPEDMAQIRTDQVRKAGRDLYFAWAGVEQRGGPHYYRIQAPAFLVEYDNTQNEANHIHSVWRDFNGDFGLDLLEAHYRASHSN
jgi:exonuclease VII small subunit